MPLRPSRFFLSTFLRSTTAAVFAAFLLRFFFLWRSHQIEDAAHNRFLSWGLEALMVAQSLATGYGFSNPFPHYVYVTAWLAPVYPWLLSLGVLIFRVHEHSLVIFAQVLNVIFSSLTCYPIYFLCRKIHGPRLGLASAWLWAILPGAILMPIEWTWDQSLSALLLCLLLLFTYWLCETSSPLHWSGYGLLWGVAALTNPTLCVLLPFVTIWLWFQRRRGVLPSASLLTRAALFFVLTLLPWTMRNYFELGGLFFVKSNFGLELWLGNNPLVKNVYSLEHHPMRNYAEYRFLVLTSEPYYNRLKQQDALAFIRANPKTFLKLSYNRFVDMWTGKFDVRADTYIQPMGVGRICVWYTTMFSLFAFAGLIVALSTKPGESLPLAFCVLFFPIPYYITHSSLRYRHPIDPVLTILAVIVAARLASLVRLRKDSLPSTVSQTTIEDHEPVHA
jgi:4-amino-4-deoxy-L-arabinose transferase-like glycosyltransferase